MRAKERMKRGSDRKQCAKDGVQGVTRVNALLLFHICVFDGCRLWDALGKITDPHGHIRPLAWKMGKESDR